MSESCVGVWRGAGAGTGTGDRLGGAFAGGAEEDPFPNAPLEIGNGSGVFLLAWKASACA